MILSTATTPPVGGLLGALQTASTGFKGAIASLTLPSGKLPSADVLDAAKWQASDAIDAIEPFAVDADGRPIPGAPAALTSSLKHGYEGLHALFPNLVAAVNKNSGISNAEQQHHLQTALNEFRQAEAALWEESVS